MEQSKYKETLLERRLIVLAQWLTVHTESYDYERYGVLESAIRQSKVDTMQQIGSYLLEILEFSDEQLEIVLMSIIERNGNN